MEVNARQELPAYLAPVYFQYAIDKIICSRETGDTPSKAIKCIGLYGVIVRMAVEQVEITRTALAERIGCTYQGILNPLEYLIRLHLVMPNLHEIPGTNMNVQHLRVPALLVENARRELKRITTLQPGEDLIDNGLTIPPRWRDVIPLLLDSRMEGDTTAKALKAIGLIPIMARLATIGLPITRPVLAQRLGIAENTITPIVGYLEKQGLVDVEERRIKGYIGSEYAIHLPPAIVERVRRAIREWPDSQYYRKRCREICDNLAERYGNRSNVE